MNPITISLPWPPSANNYWRRNGGRYFISAKGQAYRAMTKIECRAIKRSFSADKRLRVQIVAFPPDRRRRDLDNICKCIMDSLQHAEVYVDDNQIDWLTVRRRPEILNKVNIIIDELD